MADFYEQAKLRYDELLKQRASIRTEIRSLKKLFQNAGALKKVTKQRKPKTS